MFISYEQVLQLRSRNPLRAPLRHQPGVRRSPGDLRPRGASLRVLQEVRGAARKT